MPSISSPNCSPTREDVKLPFVTRSNHFHHRAAKNTSSEPCPWTPPGHSSEVWEWSLARAHGRPRIPIILPWPLGPVHSPLLGTKDSQPKVTSSFTFTNFCLITWDFLLPPDLPIFHPHVCRRASWPLDLANCPCETHFKSHLLLEVFLDYPHISVPFPAGFSASSGPCHH